MENYSFYKSVRFKLIGAVTLVVLAASVIGYHISVRVADKEFKKLIYQQFTTTTHITENFIDFLGQTSLMRARSLAMDKRLGELVSNGDSKELGGYVVGMMKRATADTLIVVDGDGLVRARGHEPARRGDLLMGVEMVRKAVRDGVPTTTIVQDLSNFIVFSSGVIPGTSGPGTTGPSTTGPGTSGTPAGAVLLGYAINDTFVEKIKKNMDVDIAIVRDRAIMASTMRDENGERISVLPIPYLEYQLLLEGKVKAIETVVFGRKSFISGMNLAGMAAGVSGSILLIHPYENREQIKIDIQMKFALLFAVIFIAVVFLAHHFSKRVLKPINELVDVTDRVGFGDHAVRAHVSTNDEFGRLATHFNEMVSAIGQKDMKLKLYSEELEEMVADRTVDLEASNRLKELFMDIVCHDLSGPVNVILNSSEHLLENEKNRETMDFLKIILGSSTDLRELIRDANAYSHLETIDRLDRDEVDLDVMVREAASGMQLELDERNVRIELPYGGAHKANANPLIKEVFVNLISNAIKYSPDNGVVEVALETSNGFHTLSVKDSGSGIPDDHKEKIFERFERLEKGDVKGIGLGLAIAKRVVDLHGGKVWVEDNPKGGSIFFVRLPA